MHHHTVQPYDHTIKGCIYNRQRASYDFNVKEDHDISQYDTLAQCSTGYNNPLTPYTSTGTGTDTTPRNISAPDKLSNDKYIIHQKLQQLQQQQLYLIQQLFPEPIQSPNDRRRPTYYNHGTAVLEHGDGDNNNNIAVPEYSNVNIQTDTSHALLFDDADYMSINGNDGNSFSNSSPEYSINEFDDSSNSNNNSINSTSIRDTTGKRIFYCGTCNKSFHHKGTLRRHLRIHTGEKPYTCAQCNRSFNQKIALITHMRTHTGEKPYSCDICTQQFAYKNNLTAHQRKHSELGEKPYCCGICQKSFGYRGTLERHKKSHQNEWLNQQNNKIIKPYVCTVNGCHKQFNKQSLLQQHSTTHYNTGKNNIDADDTVNNMKHEVHNALPHNTIDNNILDMHDGITNELLPLSHHNEPQTFTQSYDARQYTAEQQFNEQTFDQPLHHNYDDIYHTNELEYLFGCDTNFRSNPSIHTIAMH